MSTSCFRVLTSRFIDHLTAELGTRSRSAAVSTTRPNRAGAAVRRPTSSTTPRASSRSRPMLFIAVHQLLFETAAMHTRRIRPLLGRQGLGFRCSGRNPTAAPDGSLEVGGLVGRFEEAIKSLVDKEQMIPLLDSSRWTRASCVRSGVSCLLHQQAHALRCSDAMARGTYERLPSLSFATLSRADQAGSGRPLQDLVGQP